jgi:cephalosporin hydroxylase
MQKVATLNKKVLIFPAGMPGSLEYLHKCLQEGRDIVGSSSLGYDPSREQYPAWVHLPYVTDPEFNEALQQVIQEFGIGEIFTPNIYVWNYLNKTLGKLGTGASLANSSPIDEVLGGYRTALSKARSMLAHQLPLTSCVAPHPELAEIQLAATVRYADIIPGMCDDDKFRAMLEMARYTVPGDIVEIGSWWGKSAFILAALSRSFDIGKLLCVDPWKNENLVQGLEIVDSGSAQVDADEALQVFQIGLIPFNANSINYLRMPSANAAVHFAGHKSISSAEFGTTEYSGKISVLHIDGNHVYEAVKADVEGWGKLVIEGGWIVFDDYFWPWGDGPKRVGDEFLENNRARIATAFVMGTALFIQLSRSGK